MSKLKLFMWVAVLAFACWIGLKSYYFFFDVSQPQLVLSGIADSGYYAGDVACTVSGEHPYSVKNITVLLDGKPLAYNFSIGKSSFEYPFSLPTKTLLNGPHELQIRLVDGTFHRNKITKTIQFFVDNTALQAAFVKQNTDYRVFQGKTLHLQFQTSKQLKDAVVNLFSQKFPCFPETNGSLVYEAFVPVGCEATPNEYMFTIDCHDCVDNVVTLEGKVQVIPFPFKKYSLHVDSKKMEEEKEISQSQDLLNADLKRITQESPRQKLWTGDFYVPTEIVRISTEFGGIRVTPEKGKYAHKGVDIVNHPRSVVWAPQDGKVVIKDRYLYSGNTVVIDHGWGILSLFYHLDGFSDNIEVGKMIKKGNPLGRVGKTGYASGYHLHWEMRINDVEVDPLEWTKPTF